MRKRAFNFRTRGHSKAPKGLPLSKSEIERLLGRLDQYTSVKLGEMAGLNACTILHAAQGDPITHESARKILNMLEKLEEEEAGQRRWAAKNLEVASRIVTTYPVSEEGLRMAESCAAAAEVHAARANTEAYRETIAALQAQIERLRQ